MNLNRKNVNKRPNIVKPNIPNSFSGATLSDKVSNIAKGAMNKISNLGTKVTGAVADVKQKVTNKIANSSEKIKAAPISEQVANITSKTSQFMQANSSISKFVAVVLSLILFYIFFNIGVSILKYFFMASSSPAVLNGLINSNKQTIIYSNPNLKNAVPILRSINEDQGLEFTWGVWYYIDNMTHIQENNNYALIFSKGVTTTSSSATPSLVTNLNQMLTVCPGAYISYPNNSNSAQLTIALNTYIDPALQNIGTEYITIDQIPIQKWVHCAIRVQNKSVDIYINGTMTQRKNLLTLPKQNYYDTYIGDPNGFAGYISSLNYYDHALNYDQIQSDFVKGPNMRMANDNSVINKKDYLSMNWFYNSK